MAAAAVVLLQHVLAGDQGRILPRKYTGLPAHYQRRLNKAIKRARQMFDPVGLGYPLLMERDQYWPCGGQGGQSDCENSPTLNSAPIWSIQRADWEKAGGVTVGTVDPPKNRKLGAEGQGTSKTSIGELKLGRGKVRIVGALLPQPTKEFDHQEGLEPHAVTYTGYFLVENLTNYRRPRGRKGR